MRQESTQEESSCKQKRYTFSASKRYIASLLLYPQKSSYHDLGIRRREKWKKNDRLSELKVAQSCLTLCDPMDCNLPGSSVHGDSEASMLQWIAMPSSRGSSLPRDRTQISCTVGRFFTSEPPGKTDRADGGCIFKLKARINQEEKTILKRRDGAIMS